MRVVLQRVRHARVTVDNETVGQIGRGFLILLGVEETDTETVADKMADKLCRLRIFEDENGKTNLSLADVDGELLIVSQFTLMADCHKGNRPSFIKAGSPQKANALYEYFQKRCALHVKKVEHGVFGAEMQVELLNDGPFTIVLEADENGVR